LAFITNESHAFAAPSPSAHIASTKCRQPPLPSAVSSSKLTLRSSENDDNGGDQGAELKAAKKKLTGEFFGIAIPAFMQLTAEPLAAIVDTAYLGRLGPEVLGGAGVAISAQYAVSKLYNDPLLRTSISLVAAQDGKARSIDSKEGGDHTDEKAAADLSVAVSSALLLAFTVGFVQLFVYTFLASGIIRGMGVDSISPMWHSAISYLRVRALGTPAATLWLVTNGVFRGLGDTKTPLAYALLFAGLNAILDPFFIFTLKFGASGAAAGTAIAQYIALVPLLLALNKKVKIDIIGQLKELGNSLTEYLEAGGFVLIRTFGKVLAYSVCARAAALLGPVAAAAYNLTFQLGFATTQICEAVAVAVQTLLAREISDTTTKSKSLRAKSIKYLIDGSIGFGAIVAGSLSLLTFFQRDSILKGLTNNAPVREAAAAVFPAVLATQVLKGLAYPVNGIVMGGLDWKFTMLAMWAANAVCVGMIRLTPQGAITLNTIWWALAAFMGTQVVTGIIRFQSRTGIWKALKETDE